MLKRAMVLFACAAGAILLWMALASDDADSSLRAGARQDQAGANGTSRVDTVLEQVGTKVGPVAPEVAVAKSDDPPAADKVSSPDARYPVAPQAAAIKPPQASVLSGWVRLADGTPVGNQVVQASAKTLDPEAPDAARPSGDPWTMTKDDGSFHLDVVDGHVYDLVTPDEGVVLSEVTAPAQYLQISLDRLVVKVRLDEGLKLREGTAVHIKSMGAMSDAHPHLDADGRCQASLKTGPEYTIEARVGERRFSAGLQAGLASGVYPVTLHEVTGDLARVDITVSEPFAHGLRLRFEPNDGSGRTEYVGLAAGKVKGTSTFLPPGEYKVSAVFRSVGSKLQARPEPDQVLLLPGEVHGVHVALIPGGVLEFTTPGPEAGDALPTGWQVQIRPYKSDDWKAVLFAFVNDENGTRQTRNLQEGGLFRVKDCLAPGKWQLRIHSGDGDSTPVTVEVVEGEAVRAQLVDLPPY